MWTEFYKNRVNSSYQDYFIERYKSFLDKIVELDPEFIIEEGCGIGSISKYLYPKGIEYNGFDIDFDMVDLANCNTNSSKFYRDNILKPDCAIWHDISDLHITHGVLEHLNDEQIKSIFQRYKKYNKPSIHYVPLDKYKTPSFGDERLLSYEFWLEISGASEYQLFNDDYDLWFLIK